MLDIKICFMYSRYMEHKAKETKMDLYLVDFKIKRLAKIATENQVCVMIFQDGSRRFEYDCILLSWEGITESIKWSFSLAISMVKWRLNNLLSELSYFLIWLLHLIRY